MQTVFWMENLKVRDHSEDKGVRRKKILDLRQIGWQGLDWRHLPQHRDCWRALANMIMNFLVP